MAAIIFLICIIVAGIIYLSETRHDDQMNYNANKEYNSK